MKKILITALLMGSLGAASVVQAVSIISVEVGEAGLPADITFDGFPDASASTISTGVPIPGGSLVYGLTDAVIITGSDITNEAAIPQPGPNGDYMSILTGGVAIFIFNDAWGSFAFQWGSVDSYNTISFSLGGVLQNTFTGSDILDPANGNQGLTGSAYVTFGGPFDVVTLTSSQNSFEIDNVSVSDGGMTLALLGLTLSGLAFVRRKTLVG